MALQPLLEVPHSRTYGVIGGCSPGLPAAVISTRKLLYNVTHQRRYAPLFNWRGPDREQARRAKERNITKCWLAALYRDACAFVHLDSCSPPKPDCELTDKLGRKTGVEITELVNQKIIESNQKKLSHGREYTHDQVFEAVTKILEKKEYLFEPRADQIRNEWYEKMILIIHTAEPALTPDFCRACFENRTFPKLRLIDEAFLLFGTPRMKDLNDHEAQFCQVVRIPV